MVVIFGVKWCQILKKYSTDELFVHVIDSGSVDSTKLIAEEAGFDVTCISSKDFNHGGTRNQAVYKYINEFDIVIFFNTRRHS